MVSPWNPGQTAPDGTPIGAIYEMQAQAARLQQQRAQERMRASGATCDIDCVKADGVRGACEVPPIGRCATCHRAFCQSHGSTFTAGDGAECRQCQDQRVARREEQARAQAAEAEAARNTARKQRAQRQREHERLVAEWEKLNDWAARSGEIAELDKRITKLYRRTPATRGSLAECHRP